jgi:hypothetical protein
MKHTVIPQEMNVFDLHQAVPDAETGAVLCAADISDHGELIQVKKYVKNGSSGIFVLHMKQAGRVCDSRWSVMHMFHTWSESLSSACEKWGKLSPQQNVWTNRCQSSLKPQPSDHSQNNQPGDT